MRSGAAWKMKVTVLVTVSLGLWAAAPSAFARPGDLDPGYGTGGFAPAESPTTLDSAGRLVAFAHTPAGMAAVERLTPAGGPDTGFGVGGMVTLGGPKIVGVDIAEQSSGAVVVLATDGTTLRLFRVTAAGVLDPSMNEVAVPGWLSYGVTGMAIAPDDGIVVSTGDRILRYSPDGTPDPDFGSGGAFDVPNEVDAFAQDPRGGYLVGWRGMSDGSASAKLGRVDEGGAIDESWGSNGVVDLGGVVFGGADWAFLVAARADGEVAVGSSGYPYRPAPPVESRVAMLNSAGAINTVVDAPTLSRSFGLDGPASIDDLAWDATGRLLLTGMARIGDPVVSNWSVPELPYVARLRADGEFDAAFADAGIARFPTDFGAFSAGLQEILIQPDGRILANTEAGGRPSEARLIDDSSSQPNADADQLVDAEDSCPRRFARTQDGCERANVTVTLERQDGDLQGVVDGPDACLATRAESVDASGRDVLLVRADGREPKTIDRAELGPSYSFEDVQPGHVYRAVLPEILQPGVVRCLGASSPAIGLLGLSLKAAPRVSPAPRLRARARCGGLDCKLTGRAIVHLERRGRKPVRIVSRELRTRLERGSSASLTFLWARGDADRVRRSLAGSRYARAHSSVVFETAARARGQADRAVATSKFALP